VKALVVAPRFPWPPYTGERLRATIWLSALEQEGEVALVSPGGTVPGRAPRFRFYPARRSLRHGVRRAVAAIRDGLPFQCLLAASYDWKSAIAQARREAGRFDVTVILLSRLHPWVSESLDRGTVLDAVDSLRRSAAERSRSATGLRRWFWQIEQRRMGRIEQEAARSYERVVVVSEEEKPEFGRAVAVGNGIPAGALAAAHRDFDLGFWGRLPYFANADAATWILDGIWPAIRALRPDATFVLGGAEASRSLRNHARRRGVPLVSPIEDIAAFARRIRVVILPLRYGSGESNKVLEAAEAGCAIVATPEALRGLAPLASFARIESSTAGLARAAVELLADDAARRRMVEGLRSVIERHYARTATLDRLSAIARSVESR
jgi:glycosyltransferase involved in cell wall biosynthesis